MFERLGIVTNIWAEEIENGARFDELMMEFGANGFRNMEVREGAYLRNAEFGDMMHRVELVMPEYTDAEFQTLCEAVWAETAYETKHPTPFEEVANFVRKAAGLTLSYAISHPWLSTPADNDADSVRIIMAKRLAYLLCPSRARLRLVDLDTEGDIDETAAVANIERYATLLPDYPMVFAVENARQTATLTLKLAIAGGAKLTYDETNTYRADGTTLNPPDEFWRNVRMETVTAVHFKQKTEAGVLPVIGDGYVDFRAIANHLRTQNYSGELLLENKPTVHSLADALRSREYLLACC